MTSGGQGPNGPCRGAAADPRLGMVVVEGTGAPPQVRSWLLSGDPAVRWQTLQLLGAAPGKVVAERARVATSGWGARLLAEQADDGSWGGGDYSPKWTSTTYTLLLLRQLGLPAGSPQAVVGCLRLLDRARWLEGGLTFGKTPRGPETCITALVAGVGAAFGVGDARLERVVGWLLDQQLGDGGWNCQSLRSGSRHGSFHTTILVLEALQEWLELRGPDAAVSRAAADGREFFCVHRLYCSHRTGEVVDRAFTRTVFPPGWRHDLLRGLDHFQRAGAARDPRLADAVHLLQRRRRSDGTWVTNAPPRGRYWFELERPGRPGRINTVRALRVLGWWGAPAGSAGAITTD